MCVYNTFFFLSYKNSSFFFSFSLIFFSFRSRISFSNCGWFRTETDNYRKMEIAIVWQTQRPTILHQFIYSMVFHRAFRCTRFLVCCARARSGVNDMHLVWCEAPFFSSSLFLFVSSALQSHSFFLPFFLAFTASIYIYFDQIEIVYVVEIFIFSLINGATDERSDEKQTRWFGLVENIKPAKAYPE